MTTIKTILEEFEEAIQERVLNKDNPQYALGWNACRYLSKSFLSTKLNEMLGEIEKEIKATQEEVSESQGTHKHDSCYDDALTIISKYKD